jgi:hypothetical protein
LVFAFFFLLVLPLLLPYNPGDNLGNGMDAPLVFVISGDFFFKKMLYYIFLQYIVCMGVALLRAGNNFLLQIPLMPTKR